MTEQYLRLGTPPSRPFVDIYMNLRATRSAEPHRTGQFSRPNSISPQIPLPSGAVRDDCSAQVRPSRTLDQRPNEMRPTLFFQSKAQQTNIKMSFKLMKNNNNQIVDNPRSIQVRARGRERASHAKLVRAQMELVRRRARSCLRRGNFQDGGATVVWRASTTGLLIRLHFKLERCHFYLRPATPTTSLCT